MKIKNISVVEWVLYYFFNTFGRKVLIQNYKGHGDFESFRYLKIGVYYFDIETGIVTRMY